LALGLPNGSSFAIVGQGFKVEDSASVSLLGLRSTLKDGFRLKEPVLIDVSEGVDLRTSGGGLRAKFGGRGDAGGKAGSLAPAPLVFVLVLMGNAGEVGAGDVEVEVVGVVAVTSVNVLNEVDMGDVGESTTAGGIAWSNPGNAGEGGSGIRWAEGDGEGKVLCEGWMTLS
jgi:hypothetical protein